MADAFANLTTTLTLSEGETTNIPVCNRWVLPSLDTSDHENSNVITVATNDEEYWRTLLIEYLKHNKLPEDTGHKTEKVLEVMTEPGVCSAHQFGPKLQFRIKRMSYYWPTMINDYLEYVKKCKSCQLHANFIHQPSKPLHPTVASWPFDASGLDVVGPITPKSSAGHIL
ncbi:UNVERIFIED_CONTAM: hypothetical protein Scaly_0599300 [Sesamum calycinum]|uniref:Integrase zinc-binding domain-containing protein n=1 Tax=Sesamum calycinum TaxID=2727403 RepID=A0AAW2RS86_9LAMI